VALAAVLVAVHAQDSLLDETASEEPPMLGLPPPPPSRVAEQSASELPRRRPPPPSESSADSNSVQFMITNKMQDELRALGYTSAEIRTLAPERARVLIAHNIKRTRQGVPKHWQRGGGAGTNKGAPLAVVSRVATGLGLAMGAAYLADPRLVEGWLVEIGRWARDLSRGSLRALRRPPAAARARPRAASRLRSRR
jgi:hypothetical protein